MMPQATVRANPLSLPKPQRPIPTEKDFIDDLSYLPDRYAMPVVGDCLEPEISSGAVLIFDKTQPYVVGDLVILFRRREQVPTGSFQGMVKRLVMAPPPWVTFPFREHSESEIRSLVVVEQLNPRGRLVIACENLIGIHKCLGIAPPELRRVKVKLPDECRAPAQGRL